MRDKKDVWKVLEVWEFCHIRKINKKEHSSIGAKPCNDRRDRSTYSLKRPSTRTVMKTVFVLEGQ
jgi:hypothetical protein